jgi:GNAT superfamily N-acetyltransferase
VRPRPARTTPLRRGREPLRQQRQQTQRNHELDVKPRQLRFLDSIISSTRNSTSKASRTINVSRLTYRDATPADLGFIIRLIVDDSVVATNDEPDRPDHPRYLAAFEAITADPNQRLVVAQLDGQSVGTLQLTFIPGINRLGEWRCIIEAVHIAPTHRNLGLGSQMIRWAIEQARQRGCGLVQLTSNKKRLDAHRFYERLGFAKSHEGFKLAL